MRQIFYGKLKDELDIAYHFGFEGCAGFGDMMARLDGMKILFATLDEDNGFFLLAQDKNATDFEGLYAVIPNTTEPTQEDFVVIPAHAQGTMLLLYSPFPPEGLAEFFTTWLPIATAPARNLAHV